METILTAYDGYADDQHDMARIVFGSQGIDIDKGKENASKVTPALFRAFARDHNITRKAK